MAHRPWHKIGGKCSRVISQRRPVHMKLGQGPLRRLFSLEHSRAAYLADFALLYGSVAVLAAFLVATGRAERSGEVAAFAIVGLGSWTLMEYVLHRFVLHG